MLKNLVNNFELYKAFQDNLRDKIAHSHRQLEQATALEEVYRIQGQIMALKKLLSLREEINDPRN